MTGHKKRFCSFGLWTRITNITKTTEYVRNVAFVNTHPDVSAVKSVLHRTQRVNADNCSQRLSNIAIRDYRT